eukprot:1195162-Prorocentrum_minimum.AAC.4
MFILDAARRAEVLHGVELAVAEHGYYYVTLGLGFLTRGLLFYHMWSHPEGVLHGVELAVAEHGLQVAAVRVDPRLNDVPLIGREPLRQRLRRQFVL